MQVFLSHSSHDKDVVEPIGSFLHRRGLTVWLDAWSMTPGDSLIDKIGEGIELSDRLVVFLTPHSADSNWVKKEVASGLVMEIAEEKGLGEKFVVPALLVPCKIPVMLRDKLYANFTNKAFEAACEELLAGVLDTPRGPRDARLENRIFRVYPGGQRADGTHTLIVEFGVRISPSEGAHIAIDVDSPYTKVIEWFGPPGQGVLQSFINTNIRGSQERRQPPIFAHKFSEPGITSTRSYYIYFESPLPLNPKAVQFLDSFDRIP